MIARAGSAFLRATRATLRIFLAIPVCAFVWAARKFGRMLPPDYDEREIGL